MSQLLQAAVLSWRVFGLADRLDRRQDRGIDCEAAYQQGDKHAVQAADPVAEPEHSRRRERRDREERFEKVVDVAAGLNGQESRDREGYEEVQRQRRPI